MLSEKIIHKVGRIDQNVRVSHEWSPQKIFTINELGCSLPPFKGHESRWTVLKTKLDAIYSKPYGLTTNVLHYILDPQDVYAPDFRGETFRVLKVKELGCMGSIERGGWFWWHGRI